MAIYPIARYTLNYVRIKKHLTFQRKTDTTIDKENIMQIPKETDDEDIVKFKRMNRKCALNLMVWHENNSSPTEQDADQLDAIAEKILETSRAFKENIKYWIKHTTTLKLKEHQEHLKDNQVPYDE